MNPGKLNRKVAIEFPRAENDGMGGRSVAWIPLCSVWACFEKPAATTEIQQGGVVSAVTYPVTIRYRADVKPGCRLIYTGRVYSILDVLDVGMELTRMNCEEVKRNAP